MSASCISLWKNMWVVLILGIFSITTCMIVRGEDILMEEVSTTFVPTTVVSTDLPPETTTIEWIPTTTEKELLYLELEYEDTPREDFWNDNRHECINGTLVPSAYLRRKYGECKKIHRRNPECTKNCQLAATMLLGEKRIPIMDLYEEYFRIVLPEKLSIAITSHYRKCFAEFGKNEKDFLDYSCKRPQPFYSCAREFEPFLVC